MVSISFYKRAQQLTRNGHKRTEAHAEGKWDTRGSWRVVHGFPLAATSRTQTWLRRVIEGWLKRFPHNGKN